MLHAVLSLCAFYSLYLLYIQGYALLALLLLAPVSGLLWWSRREPMAGVLVRWRQGLWTVERDGVSRWIDVLPRSSCLPWMVYLCWRELPGGGRGHVCLFADSAPREQLRRLRVRLSLQ